MTCTGPDQELFHRPVGEVYLDADSNGVCDSVATFLELDNHSFHRVPSLQQVSTKLPRQNLEECDNLSRVDLWFVPEEHLPP